LGQGQGGCFVKAPEVTYRLTVEQDDTPVRGNALASGDDAEDKQCEDEILARLDRGDVWAWALVKVIAECGSFYGADYLGGCCYKDEKDFIACNDYYESMKSEALLNLKQSMKAAVQRGAEAAKLLKRLK